MLALFSIMLGRTVNRRPLLFMEKYSRGRRGAPAKGVGRVTGARVQIPPSPPRTKARVCAPFFVRGGEGGIIISHRACKASTAQIIKQAESMSLFISEARADCSASVAATLQQGTRCQSLRLCSSQGVWFKSRRSIRIGEYISFFICILRTQMNDVATMSQMKCFAMKLPSANDVVLRTNGKHEKATIRPK